MANLTNPDGHETESPESKWAAKFYIYFIRAADNLKIKGFDIGENYYQFNDGKQTVTIKFTVK